MPAAANDEHDAVIALYVTPRAGRTEIAGQREGAVWVKLAAPPVAGAANEALIRFLASRLGVSRSAVTLLSGATGRRKRVQIAGLDPASVRARLQHGLDQQERETRSE